MLWGGPFAVCVLSSCNKACAYATRVAQVLLMGSHVSVMRG